MTKDEIEAMLERALAKTSEHAGTAKVVDTDAVAQRALAMKRGCRRGCREGGKQEGLAGAPSC